MGRTKCEYDAGPDVTRFAALKSKHEELQHRVSLFEELFRLLSMRSEGEAVEIIRRMRTTNMETDLDDLIKFIKNADLLIQLASAPSEATSPATGPAAEVGTDARLPADELSSLLEKSAISKLDAPARTAFLDTIRFQIDALAMDSMRHLTPAAVVDAKSMPDGDSDVGLEDEPMPRPGGFLRGLLNDDDMTRPN
ncbi:hypothetical protein CTRI78_v009316 [Colletotrichum trifolii]|uniref:Uncharacterized protein n=1 Tax=Colletotrichum trifolii TaxID=5466 RepID=A0A4R8QR18_COLTR|nr:hypothetical protein CTRI78_v009316 [Colletotrichum trifolii]